jgi:hypothetical protein
MRYERKMNVCSLLMLSYIFWTQNKSKKEKKVLFQHSMNDLCNQSFEYNFNCKVKT